MIPLLLILLVLPPATNRTAVPPFGAETPFRAKHASDTLRLAECYEAARAHFPLMERSALAERIAALEREDVAAAYRPSFAVDGQAVYHSDVPQLPFDVPGGDVPRIPHDQYSAVLNVSQLVYDGGIRAVRRRLAESSARLTAGEVEVALHEIREGINDAYFGALLQEAALKTLEALREEIEIRRGRLRAQIDEGLADPGAVDVLDVELLDVQQRITEAVARREAALAVLAVLTGLEAPDDVRLVAPDVAVTPISEASIGSGRPQYEIFDARREEVDLRRELAGRESRPRLSSFASAAYGRPAGMNIFETTLSPFYSVGVRISWSPWDWGSDDRQQQILELQEKAVDAQEAAFTQSLRTEAEREWRDVERLTASIERDDRIVALRTRMAERSAYRLENGVISAADYILEQQAEQRAVLARERRLIELQYAKVRYATILGRSE